MKKPMKTTTKVHYQTAAPFSDCIITSVLGERVFLARPYFSLAEECSKSEAFTAHKSALIDQPGWHVVIDERGQLAKQS